MIGSRHHGGSGAIESIACIMTLVSRDVIHPDDQLPDAGPRV